MSILWGFEIGTGRRFEIPETGHIAVFGQTQLSGKTTALEAIAFRGKLKAVAFITKQGEGGFLTGRMIPPYFSEPTNDEENPLWRWVKAILEASQQRRMVVEESFIIRACDTPKLATNLADVHANVKVLLAGQSETAVKRRGKKTESITKWIRKPASGLAASMYVNLNAYFNIVMPQLARLPYTKKLELGPGLNVMDLREYAMETQALVIRSVMEWVYQHEKNVRVIIPEVQDFVPQGKNSPVKMACETLVRKGGANKNFMWLDGQDMAAVDKFALRACSIVGIGVQTEMHEIDRSLGTMFSPALKPVDIARLKVGEFFMRTPEARVSKVYVQPAWMDSELHAQAIAKGEESVSSARQMLRAFKDSRKLTVDSRELKQVQMQEQPDVEETSENPAGIAERVSRDASAPVGTGHVAELRNLHDGKDETPVHERSAVTRAAGAGDPDARAGGVDLLATSHQPLATDFENEESMWKEKYEALQEEYRGFRDGHKALQAEHQTLIEAHDALAARVLELESSTSHKSQVISHGFSKQDSPVPGLGSRGNGTAGTSAGGPAVPRGSGFDLMPADLETIYVFVKSKASQDPGVLQMLTYRPELRVKVERPVIQMDGKSLRGQLALLIHKGFFNEPKNGNTAFNEMKRVGFPCAKPNVYRELGKLAELGFLTIEDAGYQTVAGMKVNIEK